MRLLEERTPYEKGVKDENVEVVMAKREAPKGRLLTHQQYKYYVFPS